MTLDLYCPFSYQPKHAYMHRRCRITKKRCTDPYKSHYYRCEIAEKQRQLTPCSEKE